MEREDAARRLGLKLVEVVAVEPVEAGHVVTNHVGTSTLIMHDGQLVFDVQGPEVRPVEPEPVNATPAPAARSTKAGKSGGAK